MMVQQLQEEAKKHDIGTCGERSRTIANSRKDIIAELEKLETNLPKPHFMLKGQKLEAKIKQYGIGELKAKEILAKDLSDLYHLIKTKIDTKLLRHFDWQKNRKEAAIAPANIVVMFLTIHPLLAGGFHENPLFFCASGWAGCGLWDSCFLRRR